MIIISTIAEKKAFTTSSNFLVLSDCRRFSLGATPRELNEALTTSRSRRRDHWLNALGANFTESATI